MNENLQIPAAEKATPISDAKPAKDAKPEKEKEIELQEEKIEEILNEEQQDLGAIGPPATLVAAMGPTEGSMVRQ